MKLNDVKHNHSLTDLLKILLFSILMMIPFIDVSVRCAYVVVNKNAYQSYSGESTNPKTNLMITDKENITNNTKYYLTPTNENCPRIYSEGSDNFICSMLYYNDDTYENVRLGFYGDTHYVGFVYVRDVTNQNNVLFNMQLSNENISKIWFIVDNVSNNITNTDLEYIGLKTIIYQDNFYLDNVFDYSVNKLTTSELYTWTQQTAIYTGVQTMCTHLGINNSVIPLLLVYWFILTVIYIIIDIVLKLFTMLTHAIGSKTA